MNVSRESKYAYECECECENLGAFPGTFIPHNRDYLAISKPARATIANLFDRVYLTVFMRSIRSIN